MSEQFVIQGRKKLSGEIEVRGSKNATTPILAATLLTDKSCIIHNVPRIEDVFVMVDILKDMGSDIEWLDEYTLRITNKHIDPTKIQKEKIKKIRSSILLLGSLSARFDSFSMPHPGGCVIGSRPVGTHFDALFEMGVHVEKDRDFYEVNASGRKSAKVVLNEFSVTATENVMMLACVIKEKTIIKIAASEPHVEDLGKFLKKMGVKISGLGTHTLTIEGKKRRSLLGGEHSVIADANEAATFLLLGAVSRSDIVVKWAYEDHLDLVLEQIRRFGADISLVKNGIRVSQGKSLRAVGKIDARIYPGIPTDIQAPFAVLATQATGNTIIHDTLFEGRFNYIGELQKMGANVHILNPHQALIIGKTPLSGTTIFSYDLRAGAALILASLVASGTTIVRDAYQVDRGYEKIEMRLQKIGADIRREKETK
ncbi:MAG: UDP-N-acetylglucosamine 1-carboxyvinyltransferase [Candidatus Moranbacteria bacterium]|nr:UDP-N-acetylglucosamine 1-carboxyvinyltransferase [Candidatus Moranbacteria bacterium]